MIRVLFHSLPVSLLVICLVGCGVERTETIGVELAPEETPVETGGSSMAGTPAGQAGGIAFAAPARWKAVTPSMRMRLAQFEIPPPDGASVEAGECVFYFFGEGQGGDVQANIDRWAGQFSDAERQPASAETRSLEADGIKVTLVQVSGTYASGMPMGPKTPKPGFALAGAIAEGPQGNVFIKLTGPTEVVSHALSEFEEMISQLKEAE